MTQKVYVIAPDVPKDESKSSSSRSIQLPGPTKESKRRSARAQKQSPVDLSALDVRDRWTRVLRAYILGPVALLLWPTGRFRMPWAIVGASSVLAFVLMAVGWSTVAARLENTSNGALVWLVAMAVVVLTVSTAWARAVGIAGREQPTLATVSPKNLRHPRTVGALGMVFPGFGLLMTGRFRRAACLVWIVGPLVASIAVLANRNWLWERSKSVVSPGISGAALETVFIAAAVMTVFGFFTMIVQALDGSRRFSGIPRSRTLTDVLGASLMVAMVLFTTTFQPAALGQSLGILSLSLHRDGYRLIPLGMCEVAARLDPGTPAHLANAAVMNEELGMADAADAKRQIIERRMEQYVNVVRYNKQASKMPVAFSSIADNPVDALGQTPGGETWTRIQAMIRARQDQSSSSDR